MIPCPRRTYAAFCVISLAAITACQPRTSTEERSTSQDAEKTAIQSISASSLRANLSFLASDALQGRYTPSPGLDVAAEFIASRFRECGLEAGGDDGYFQTAKMVVRRWPAIGSGLTINQNPAQKRGQTHFSSEFLAIERAKEAHQFVQLPLVKVVNAQQLGVYRDQAVIVAEPPAASLNEAEADAANKRFRELLRAIRKAQPALLLVVRSAARPVPAAPMLIAGQIRDDLPVIGVYGNEASRWFTTLKAGDTKQRATVAIPAPEDHEESLRNVIGILRGSDPVLNKTAVLVSAHYDHIGTLETADPAAMSQKGRAGDRIYNGANDDGSGTVSVIEIAQALSRLKKHPKRSIVFVTFFGEEEGGFGSRFYGTHPIFPVPDTVADINLEQVGRTDSSKGPQLGNASLTGYDYSDVPQILAKAGQETGVKVYKDNEASDPFFTRSDNASLAEQGVPAHTLTVAFEFPDYHGLGDEWKKVDYDNMAKVDRMVALGTVRIANNESTPKWNANNEKTKPFRDAQSKWVKKAD